jgi:hypothetical protein
MEGFILMLVLGFFAVIAVVVVLIGIGGGVFWFSAGHAPMSRFIRVNMTMSAVLLLVAFVWWLTLAIAHNVQGL